MFQCKYRPIRKGPLCCGCTLSDLAGLQKERQGTGKGTERIVKVERGGRGITLKIRLNLKARLRELEKDKEAGERKNIM